MTRLLCWLFGRHRWVRYYDRGDYFCCTRCGAVRKSERMVVR